jgi:chemotaxis protein histidine kinase CheA
LNRQDWVTRYKSEAGKHIACMRERLARIINEGVVLIVPRHASADTPRVDGDENLKELFRLAHTLKGSAGMVGLDDVQAVAERLEEILGNVYYDPATYEVSLPATIEAGIVQIETLLQYK